MCEVLKCSDSTEPWLYKEKKDSFPQAALFSLSSSLCLQWEDLLPWGSVAPRLPALRPPALHPLHMQGWRPGLPEDHMPQGVSV